MKRSLSAFAAALLISAAFFALSKPAASRAASMALVNALVQIQQLSNHDFRALSSWSRNWAPEPPYVVTPLQATEHGIRTLPSDDRNAIFFWLDGLGRGSLYARGVSDDQIGPRDPGSHPAPTPTPNPWRSLTLATGSLDGNVQGNVQVLAGFGAARLDGTAAMACVSFQNLAAKTASEVVFEFPLFSEGGSELGTLTLDRRGEFSPNIGIYTYGSLGDYLQNQPPASRMQNCVKRNVGTAALPILEARLVGYRIAKVVYEDGTTWIPGLP